MHARDIIIKTWLTGFLLYTACEEMTSHDCFQQLLRQLAQNTTTSSNVVVQSFGLLNFIASSLQSTTIVANAGLQALQSVTLPSRSQPTITTNEKTRW